LIPPKKNFQIFWESVIKNILKEIGFTEIYNYSFISEKESKIFKYQDKEIIKVANPMSLEQKCLRPTLIPNLLKNVKSNFRYYDKIQIFEIGKIFFNEQRTTNNRQLEKRMLTGLIAEKQGEGEFYRLKGAIDSLFNKLGISNIWYDSYQPYPEKSKLTIWHPERCAEIKIDQEKIGFLGEISLKVLKELNLRGKIVLFDLDFEKLIRLCSGEHEYQPISQHPAAVRDLAVLVSRGVKVVDVLNKINTAAGPLVRDVDLFDIYEGEELPEGKKNLAFHIIYQAKDRTLKSDEVDKIQQKIIKVLEKNPAWEVRK
jgi:phenylalanyl-tRNA synthetase beta chain